MKIRRIDHLVLTVADIDKTVAFYRDVLGMEKIVFGEGRVALAFGEQKINLHQSGREFEPRAGSVQPGSADLCFIVDDPLEKALAEIEAQGIELIDGPVKRTGALGGIVSLYFRDPDGNLVEVSNYRED